MTIQITYDKLMLTSPGGSLIWQVSVSPSLSNSLWKLGKLGGLWAHPTNLPPKTQTSPLGPSSLPLRCLCNLRGKERGGGGKALKNMFISLFVLSLGEDMK